VDYEDIELIAMAGIKENYIYIKLKELASRQSSPMGPSSLLRQHLYEKYVHNGTPSERIENDPSEGEVEESTFVVRKSALV
jgi:hypothetical protein